MRPSAPPWKCRARGHHHTMSTAAWKSRHEREIPTFPPLILSTLRDLTRTPTETQVSPMYPV